MIKKIIILLIILVSILLVSSSCSHTKYIKKHKDEICDTYCPDKVVEKIVEKQTLKIDTVYETVFVEVEMPKDTVVVYKYVTINGGLAFMDTVYATNGLAKAKAWVFKSELGLKVYNSPTYVARIDSMKKIIETYNNSKETTTDKTIKIIRTKNPWWLWWLVITAFLLGVFGKKIFGFIISKFI